MSRITRYHLVPLLLSLSACGGLYTSAWESPITDFSEAMTMDFGPVAISPDGTKIVFSRCPNGSEESADYSPNRIRVYTLHIDTRIVSEVGEYWAWDGFPSFSLDGKSIIYQAGGEGIKKLDIKNGKISDLLEGEQPALSRDGKKVAFVRATTYSQTYSFYDFPIGVGDIFVGDVDGSNVIRLTENDMPDFVPKLAPSGDKVFFMSYRNREVGLYEVNIQTKKERKICAIDTNYDSRYESGFVFDVTPNGRAVVSPIGGGLFSISLDTGEKNFLALGYKPSLSRDGKRMAFLAYKGGTRRLALFDFDEAARLRSLELKRNQQIILFAEVVGVLGIAVVAGRIFLWLVFPSTLRWLTAGMHREDTKRRTEGRTLDMDGAAKGEKEKEDELPKPTAISLSQGTGAGNIDVDFSAVEKTSKSSLRTWQDRREQERKRGGIEERMKTRELALKALDQELEGTKKLKALWKERGEIENLPPKERELYEAELDQKIAEAQAGQIEAQARRAEGQRRIRETQKEPPVPPAPPKQPSKVKRTAQEIKEQRELDALRMEQLKEKLANYRQMTYAHEWQEEIAWKKNLRVNEPEDAESMILIYDQFKADLLKSQG